MTAMLETRKGWFQEGGPDDDVVLSSRIRFGRNLADKSFIGSMTEEESAVILDQCKNVFNNALPKEEYIQGTVGNFSSLECRILAEKRLIPTQYGLNKEYPLFIDTNNRKSGYVKDTDHLRFACIRGGRNIDTAYDECRDIDKKLEAGIDYAASIDWGYMSPDLTSSGLGVRGSFLMHLPGLVRTEMIENALKAVIQHGFIVKGFHSDTGKSMADLYQISNGIAFGINEEEFRQKLDTLGRQLVHYERKGREELQKKQTLEIEDVIMRSYGILKYCKIIDYLEALEHLSNVRLGICLGLISLSLQNITQLFFLVEKSHLQAIGQTKTESDNKVFRASLIKEFLDNPA